MNYSIQAIIPILTMIVAFGYLFVYSRKKEKNEHKEKKYRVVFSIIIIILLIIMRLIR